MHCTQIILHELGDSTQVFVGIRSAFRTILCRAQEKNDVNHVCCAKNVHSDSHPYEWNKSTFSNLRRSCLWFCCLKNALSLCLREMNKQRSTCDKYSQNRIFKQFIKFSFRSWRSQAITMWHAHVCTVCVCRSMSLIMVTHKETCIFFTAHLKLRLKQIKQSHTMYSCCCVFIRIKSCACIQDTSWQLDDTKSAQHVECVVPENSKLK